MWAARPDNTLLVSRWENLMGELLRKKAQSEMAKAKAESVEGASRGTVELAESADSDIHHIAGNGQVPSQGGDGDIAGNGEVPSEKRSENGGLDGKRLDVDVEGGGLNADAKVVTDEMNEEADVTADGNAQGGAEVMVKAANQV
jgi:hypothetical protein